MASITLAPRIVHTDAFRAELAKIANIEVTETAGTGAIGVRTSFRVEGNLRALLAVRKIAKQF
jgi:hypothetical protein